MRAVLILILSLAAALPGAAQTLQSSAGPLRVDRIVGGLDEPWAFGFLPGGAVVITERDGALLLVADGRSTRVRGLPQVVASGQGGLLDVLVPRDFARSRELFLTYAAPDMRGAVTALARAELPPGAARLHEMREIFRMTGGGDAGGRHFGSRLVEARDGTLFMTTGDRGDDASAQDPAGHNGKILRLNRDGTVPTDNPFVGQPGVAPEIYSLGHRNPQGAALDARGQLWTAEHGARGGDEVNRVRPGANYGWPVISYGRHYSGRRIGEGTEKAGLAQPEFYWDPSIAPSGMAFVTGGDWGDWRGDALVGSLKFDYIARLSGTPLREVERIEGPMTDRVRDVRIGPDGAIWFLSVGKGALYRLTRAGG